MSYHQQLTGSLEGWVEFSFCFYFETLAQPAAKTIRESLQSTVYTCEERAACRLFLSYYTPYNYQSVKTQSHTIMSNSDHVCGYCQKNKSHLRCGRCGLVYYCNINCQKKHWKRHKTAVSGVYANEMLSA